MVAKDGLNNGIVISGSPSYGHVLLFVYLSNFETKKWALMKKITGISEDLEERVDKFHEKILIS